MQLKKNIVLISGASSGIGEASAKKLAAAGARLILIGRRINRLQSLAQTLQNEWEADCLPLQLDVRDKKAVEMAFSTLPTSWHNIDILINNAGLALGTDPIAQGNLDDWDTMIDTNVKGLLYLSRSVLPDMLRRQKGHIVNVGSIAGQECYINGNIYSATKHAVRAITKSMRLDLLGSPIRVTEIAPGAVETEFSIVRWNDKKRADAFYQGFNPLIAEDIADAILYCVTRPPHVDIAEMTILPTAQAGTTIHRAEKT